MLGCGALLVSAANGQTRDWHYWPFSIQSPWNTPIGSNAIFQPINGSSPFSGIATAWGNTLPDINVYSSTVSVAIAADTDPFWTLWDAQTPYGWTPNPPSNNHDWIIANLEGGQSQSKFCTDTSGQESADFLDTAKPEFAVSPDPTNLATFPFTSNPYSVTPAFQIAPVNTDYTTTFRMPLGTCGSPDGDSLLSVIQPDHFAVDFYAPIVLPNEFDVVAYDLGTFYDLEGDGTGYWNGRRASLFPTIAGLIRTGEAGDNKSPGNIPHALAVAMSPAILTAVANPVQNKAGPAWPAYSYDIPSNGKYSGGPYGLPMGALLAIPPQYTLIPPGSPGSQFFSFIGYTIAVAAQRYGVYIVDTGSKGVMNFMVELNDPDFAQIDPPPGGTMHPTPTTLRGGCTIPSQTAYCDLVVIMNNLQVVMNNGISTVGGGNPPVAYQAPPFGN
jgi:hypothetical protein